MRSIIQLAARGEFSYGVLPYEAHRTAQNCRLQCECLDNRLRCPKKSARRCRVCAWFLSTAALSSPCFPRPRRRKARQQSPLKTSPRSVFCTASIPFHKASITKKDTLQVSFFVMETRGLEPLTSRMWTERSDQLSYASVCSIFYHIILICQDLLYYLFHKNIK